MIKSIDLSTNGPLSADMSIRLNEVVKVIFKAKKSAVLTGAGISCNAGIPDFRSSDGLYNLVKSKYPKTVVKGQDLFDISLFRDEMTLSLFCTFMESLYKSSLDAKPTESHKFIKALKEKNKLLRCYTQNIDSLEKSMNLKLGINLSDFDNRKTFNKSWKNLDVIQLHGNLHKLSCTRCFASFDWNESYQDQLSNGNNPQCNNCEEKYLERLYSGKRITSNVGMLRPDIVLYGENHPQSDILTQGLNIDMKSRPDLLIIMGTSLKVDGVKKLVKSLSSSVHSKGGKVIFVNKTPLSKQWENYIDYEVLSDCDDFVRILRKEIPDLFLTQEQLDSKKLATYKGKTKSSEVLTPPTTPTKRKKATLKRSTQPKKKIKCELPTPMSSFTESGSSVAEVKQDPFNAQGQPLHALSKSEINASRPTKKIKLEEDNSLSISPESLSI